jgi:hypothetical protein
MRKPLAGAVLGIVIGVAVAVVLQRQGIWPLDQLTLFLIPAATGLLGLLLLSLGREAGSSVTLIIALIILIPMAVWGALGVGAIDEHGELNGGCEVIAASDLDQTVVTDTSRRDPFEIDPDGGLTWGATSPSLFTDYEWEINVLIGGIPITLDSDTESNDDGSLVNGDEIEDIRSYAADRGINVNILTGVYEVGGFAASCDGFGFVVLVADGLDIVALIALAVAILLLIILIILTFTGRGTNVLARSESVDVEGRLDTYEAGAEELPERGDFA